MILTLAEAIKYNKPFRAMHKTNSPNSHFAESGHIWRLPDSSASEILDYKCAECGAQINGKTSLKFIRDEWILEMDDDDSVCEDQAKDILNGLGIKVKEKVGEGVENG